MKAAVTLALMARAIGRTKKGAGASWIRLNISFNNNGGMAEPSAKCSQ